MSRTTSKFGFRLPWIAGISGAVFLFFGMNSPAFAKKNGTAECSLYTGTSSLDSLQERERILKDELEHSPSSAGGDHCEMANIHYKLSRLLPEQRTRYLNSCIDHSQQAILHDSRSAIAYFFKGLCLGRLGELRGIWGSLTIITPFRENMETAAKIDPAIDRGGPHRALGRMYYKLPVILGGDLKKSIDHLRKAVDYGPRYWENHFFLAESYYENQQYRQARSELQKAMDSASHMDDDPDTKTHAAEFQKLMKAIERNLH